MSMLLYMRLCVGIGRQLLVLRNAPAPDSTNSPSQQTPRAKAAQQQPQPQQRASTATPAAATPQPATTDTYHFDKPPQRPSKLPVPTMRSLKRTHDANGQPHDIIDLTEKRPRTMSGNQLNHPPTPPTYLASQVSITAEPKAVPQRAAYGTLAEAQGAHAAPQLHGHGQAAMGAVTHGYGTHTGQHGVGTAQHVHAPHMGPPPLAPLPPLPPSHYNSQWHAGSHGSGGNLHGSHGSAPGAHAMHWPHGASGQAGANPSMHADSAHAHSYPTYWGQGGASHVEGGQYGSYGTQYQQQPHGAYLHAQHPVQQYSHGTYPQAHQPMQPAQPVGRSSVQQQHPPPRPATILADVRGVFCGPAFAAAAADAAYSAASRAAVAWPPAVHAVAAGACAVADALCSAHCAGGDPTQRRLWVLSTSKRRDSALWGEHTSNRLCSRGGSQCQCTYRCAPDTSHQPHPTHRHSQSP